MHNQTSKDPGGESRTEKTHTTATCSLAHVRESSSSALGEMCGVTDQSFRVAIKAPFVDRDTLANGDARCVHEISSSREFVGRQSMDSATLPASSVAPAAAFAETACPHDQRHLCRELADKQRRRCRDDKTDMRKSYITHKHAQTPMTCPWGSSWGHQNDETRTRSCCESVQEEAHPH